MQSKYYGRIRAAVEESLLVLNGNRLLIELLDEGEKKTASGLIVDTGIKSKHHLESADQARAAVVLAIGPGYTCEDTGEKVAVPYEPGDILLVNQFAVKTFGGFFELAEYKPNTIGLITDDLVQGKLGSMEKLNEILRQK